jgi:hypothetical protein
VPQCVEERGWTKRARGPQKKNKSRASRAIKGNFGRRLVLAQQVKLSGALLLAGRWLTVRASLLRAGSLSLPGARSLVPSHCCVRSCSPARLSLPCPGRELPAGLLGQGGPLGSGALSQLGAFDMGSLQNLLNVRAYAASWEARADVLAHVQAQIRALRDRRPVSPSPAHQDPSLRDMAQQLAGDPAFRSLSAGAGPGAAQMVRAAPSPVRRERALTPGCRAPTCRRLCRA